MKKDLIWPSVGFVAISIAVSFSYLYESLWVGFFITLIMGMLLLIIMTWSMLSGIESAGIKKTVVYIFLGMSVLFIYNSVFQWLKSQHQKELLIEIRQTIDGTIAQMEAEQTLIESFRYKFLNEEVEHLEEAFRAVVGDRFKENGKLLASEKNRSEDLNYLANIVNPDSIIIKVIADIAEGEDLQFTNSDGQIGKYEGMATLTPNGVQYVRQN